MMSRIKKYFASGIFVTLPIFFTLYVIFLIARFIDGIWGKVINIYIKKYLGFAIPGLGLVLAVITIFVIGFIATTILGRRIFRPIERFFVRFPFIRQIYPASKQVVDSFFSRESPAFKKVVLVEYPSKGIWAIGFLTNESFREANEKSGHELMHVFIATSPSPFTGFLILMPKKDVKVLDIPVEEGVKLIVSGGIIKPAG